MILLTAFTFRAAGRLASTIRSSEVETQSECTMHLLQLQPVRYVSFFPTASVKLSSDNVFFVHPLMSNDNEVWRAEEFAFCSKPFLKLYFWPLGRKREQLNDFSVCSKTVRWLSAEYTCRSALLSLLLNSIAFSLQGVSRKIHHVFFVTEWFHRIKVGRTDFNVNYSRANANFVIAGIVWRATKSPKAFVVLMTFRCGEFDRPDQNGRNTRKSAIKILTSTEGKMDVLFFNWHSRCLISKVPEQTSESGLFLVGRCYCVIRSTELRETKQLRKSPSYIGCFLLIKEEVNINHGISNGELSSRSN